MDFLDSIDVDTTRHKKSHRVRSWYLYEQYKSLEKNQLNATQKLKDKSYQERILRQELSERKARRKLYDQYGLCPSESRVDSIISDGTKASFSVSSDDFCESFSDLQDDDRASLLTEDNYSQMSCSTCKCSIPEFKCAENIENHIESKISLNVSIESVIENVDIGSMSDCPTVEDADMANLDEVIDTQLEIHQDDMRTENITIAEPDESDTSSENDSEVISNEELEYEQRNNVNSEKQCSNNIVTVWSRILSLAFQVVHLNHGNCYCDYSSQFLTAVLAFDVLRRSVNRICDLLQPYVSPIKFATDESEVSSYRNTKYKRKKSAQSIKSRKICDNKQHTYDAKIHQSKSINTKQFWQPLSTRQYSSKNHTKQNPRGSEPFQSPKLFPITKTSKKSSQTSIWPTFSLESFEKCHPKESCTYSCRRKANPMLEIARYIDSIMMDFDDSKYT